MGDFEARLSAAIFAPMLGILKFKCLKKSEERRSCRLESISVSVKVKSQRESEEL